MRRGLVAAVLAVAMVLGLARLSPTAYAEDPAVSEVPLSGWRPDNGTVFALERVGSMVVIGGSFTRWRSPSGALVTRNGAAAVDVNTGELTSWNPNANGAVRSLETDGQTVWLGGDFTRVGNTPRARLAAVDAGTANLRTGFRADSSATVREVMLHNDLLYIVGGFRYVNGISRNRIGAVDPTSGAIDPGFSPSTDDIAYAGAIDPTRNRLVVAGRFHHVNGNDQQYLGAVQLGNGAFVDWRPVPHCQDAGNPCVLFDLAVDGDLYYGAVGGPGGRVTAWRAASAARAWSQYGDGDLQTVAVVGDSVYGGGHYNPRFGPTGTTRAGLNSMDKVTGALNDFNPLVAGLDAVWAVLGTGGSLWVGGSFTHVGGSSHPRFVRFAYEGQDTQSPSQPTDLRATTVTDEAVGLEWSPSTDDFGVAHYQVQREGQQVGTPAATAFNDSGLSPDTDYSYRVRAVDNAGNTSPWATSSVRTLAEPPDTTPPAPPGGVSTAVQDQDVAVSWNAASDPSGIASYDVHRSGSDGFPISESTRIGTVSGRSFVDGDVAPGTWFYRVTATDGAGNTSGPSATSEAYVLPPSGSVIETVQPVADSWVDEDNATANYGGSWVMQVRGGSAERVTHLRFDVPDAPPGTELSSAKLVMRTSGNSWAGSPDPAQVRSVADTSWAESGITYQNAPSTGPVIGALPGGSVPSTSYPISLDASALSGSVGGLASLALASESTDSHVFASRDDATSTRRPQLELTFSPPDGPDTSPPSVPSNVSASVTGQDVSLSWSASSDPSGVASYAVHRSTSAAFTPGAGTLVGEVTGTSFVDTGVSPGSGFYRVTATDTAGNTSAGSDAEEAVVAPPDTDPPSVPSGVATSVDAQQVTVSWSASTDVSGAASYAVHRSADPGFSPAAGNKLGDVTGTSFPDDGVAAGTWYYRVTATDSVGNTSAGSNAVEAVVEDTGGTTIETVTAAGDTWVTDAAPNANYGDSWVMQVRSGPTRTSYLRFDLPDTPAGTSLRSATLTVHTSDNAWAGTSASVPVHLVADDSWIETGMTFNNSPAVGNAVIGTLPGGTARLTGHEVDLDVPAISFELGGPASLALTMSSSDSLVLVTRDANAAGQRPTLELTFGP